MSFFLLGTLEYVRASGLVDSLEEFIEFTEHASHFSCAQDRIPNGIAAKNQFPFVVELTVQGSGGRTELCTGTLIGPGTLLTAGHCLDCVKGRAQSSSGSFTAGGSSIPFTKTLCHPQYDGSSASRFAGHDVAIVLFDPSALKAPPRYPKLASNLPVAHLKTKLVGFGANDPDAWFLDGAGTLRWGENSIESLRTVQDAVLIHTRGYLKTPHTSLFNPDGNPTGKSVGLGPGDSGGPMLSPYGSVLGVNVRMSKSLGGHPADQENWMTTTALASPSILKFLGQARSAGARFQFDSE